ncbi:MAG: hypothetical protein ACE3L7_32575 [Candidatus Pristimantibacillus sp.]
MEWNGTLPVSRHPEGLTGFESLHAKDILFFRIEKGELQAHTKDEMFHLNGGEKIQRLLDTLWASNYHFVRSDRGDIPDIGKIRKFNRAWFRAYFDPEPNENSKFIYIAKGRYDKFVELTMQYNSYIRDNPTSRT